jgi:hypothetical protein
VLTDLRGQVVHSRYQEYPAELPQPGMGRARPGRAVAGGFPNHPPGDLRDRHRSGGDPWGWVSRPRCSTCCRWMRLAEPLTPMMSWLDMRSIPRRTASSAGRHPAFSSGIPAISLPPKISFPRCCGSRKSARDLWARTYKLLDCKEYILYQLTGKIAIDWHGASVYFLFDPHPQNLV